MAVGRTTTKNIFCAEVQYYKLKQWRIERGAEPARPPPLWVTD